MKEKRKYMTPTVSVIRLKTEDVLSVTNSPYIDSTGTEKEPYPPEPQLPQVSDTNAIDLPSSCAIDLPIMGAIDLP